MPNIRFAARTNSWLDDEEAQVIGEVLQGIAEREGRVNPQAVVDEARPEGSRIHDHFEWDDSVAAEAHRKQQARQLVRQVVIVKDGAGNDVPHVPCFVSVRSADADLAGEEEDEEEGAPERREYVTIFDALSNKHQRLRLLDDLMRRIVCYREQLALFPEMQDLVDAIDEATVRMNRLKRTAA